MGSLKLLTKRKKFILVSFFTLGCSLLFQSLYIQYGLLTVLSYIVITYIALVLALKEDVKGIEYITLFILPVLFVVGINLFIQTLPERKLYRWPLYSIIPLGTYCICLAENIFNVAASRTIQLLRAAHAVVYLITLVTGFFLIAFILSLHLPIWFNTLLIAASIMPLTFQFLWSFDLAPKITIRTLIFTSITTLVFAQITVFLNFYPISAAFGTLFLIAVYYVLLGILEHYYEKKLTRKPTVEYFIVACVVFVIMLLSVNWLG